MLTSENSKTENHLIIGIPLQVVKEGVYIIMAIHFKGKEIRYRKTSFLGNIIYKNI